jgi:hypothetical protein
MLSAVEALALELALERAAGTIQQRHVTRDVHVLDRRATDMGLTRAVKTQNLVPYTQSRRRLPSRRAFLMRPLLA